MLFTVTNAIPVTMKLIEMCGAKSPQFISIFTKAVLISSCEWDFIGEISTSALVILQCTVRLEGDLNGHTEYGIY